MTFDAFFRTVSYLTIASGAFALAVSGGLSAGLAAAFAVLLAVAWRLEGTRWQLSERVALFVVLAGLPLLYLDWLFQTQTGGRANVAALVHLTLFLSSVKLFQVKANRDWLFLYLISFFEVLLAAGLSVSPMFFAALCLYVFVAMTTVVAFEIKRSASGAGGVKAVSGKSGTLRLPLVSFGLLALVFVLAVPVFFIAPRSASSAFASGGGRTIGLTGFSTEMRLGDIGTLQQSDEIVMRVRLDRPPTEGAPEMRWRGVAFDYFDGVRWRKSDDERTPIARERNLFQIDTTENVDRLTTQTFFVEPVDVPVLFAAPRVIALHGAFPNVAVDDESALFTSQRSSERVSYRAYSDTEQPAPDEMRADRRDYDSSMRRYLQLPRHIDPRINELAREITTQAGAQNRYDAARAIEAYLQTFNYTLQMRASGGDPLADFLFRVREGHCEYFSSAMAVMLRTQGTPARVVSGFQMGDYNSASDAYTVRQRHAHSWVEVYFPGSRAWVAFDPTPAAGRPANTVGAWSALGKYTDALELFWIQYVVAYDRQEQRTLAATLRAQISDYERTARAKWNDLRSALAAWNKFSINGARLKDSVFAILILLTVGGFITATLILVKRTRRSDRHRKRDDQITETKSQPVIAFYERMTRLLESRGLNRAAGQTPLEFAAVVAAPDALFITRAYHRVRYGARNLTPTETKEIEDRLRRMENKVIGDR